MAVITETISERNFELIGVQIGAILADELAAQAYTADIVVWNERVSRFGPEELPAVNVSYYRTGFSDQSVITKRGESRYFIDIRVNAKNAAGTEADETAARKAQRIAGIVDYILSHPSYVRLGYVPGTVGSRWVSDIQVGKFDPDDSMHTVGARVTFNVIANEHVNDLEGVLIEEIHTQAKLNETEYGFRYEL